MAGNVVFFLEPPTTVNEILNTAENLHIVRYQRKFKGLNLLPGWVRLPLMKIEWAAIQKLIATPIDIIWSFDPFRFQDLHLLSSSFSVFHAVDLVNSSWDAYTAGNADLVLVTNRKIMERYQDLDGIKYQIGHGLSSSFLDQPDHSTAEFKVRKRGRPAIGYSGNLLIDYLDRETMLHLVEANADYDFYFFGPYQKSNLTKSVQHQAEAFVQSLRNQDNCILLGAIPPRQLYGYLSQMDVLLICYNTGMYLNEVADPHKVLEYLSTGKTVVASYTLAYEKYKHLVEMTSENSGLGNLLREVVDNITEYNSETRVSLRKKFARERTYEKKIKEIEGVIQQNIKYETC